MSDAIDKGGPEPFKNGPLPKWGLHPRYVLPDERDYLCDDCEWRGKYEAYRKHRAAAHPRPSLTAPRKST